MLLAIARRDIFIDTYLHECIEPFGCSDSEPMHSMSCRTGEAPTSNDSSIQE